MALHHKLAQHQRMLFKMALTPQMRQSIRLLSMSSKDLIGYIDSIAAQNPFLQKLYEKKSIPPETKRSLSSEYIPQQKAREENPREALLSQLRMAGLSDKMLEIAEYLIYEMDENGYITLELEEIAEELSINIQEAKEALSAIQQLEPPGIGARDVRECMQLQLRRMGKEDSLEYKIVTDFINELAANDIKKISKALNIDMQDIQKAIANIKKLNPRPASTILSRTPEMVIPDLIAKLKNNKVHLELNRDWTPRLKLYNPYEDKLEIVEDPEAKKFLKENMDAARHLIDNIKRREETMCKVADYILTFQKETFSSDKFAIKTLTIKDVADALKLHPSTISRTVSNKYILIDNRVTPLKSFLSHGMKKENGEMTSKTAVKSRIQELIRNEDKSKPLSDTRIKELLAQEGIIIKRRTVAKYRESLRILPLHLRKKQT